MCVLSPPLAAQGEIGDNLYIVADGAFEVRVNEGEGDGDGRGRLVHRYMGSAASGQHPVFGELALQYKGAVRAATVTAARDGVLWSITRRVFKCVLLRMSTRQELLRTLRRVEVLRSLSLAQLQRLADVVSDARFSAGENVMEQGARGDAMFVVHEGSASATKTADGAQQQLCAYAPGDYFGERALLTNEPRAANVTATSAVLKCYRIERRVFETELGPLQHLIDADRRRREDALVAIDDDEAGVVQPDAAAASAPAAGGGGAPRPSSEIL